MKVIIDLIEDIRTAINNDENFSLVAMGLKEKEGGEYTPSWESLINSMKIDDENNKLFLFLGKDTALSIGEFLHGVDALANEKMMYEVCVSYLKDEKRVDSSLLGYGESLEDKKYLIFIPQ